MQPCESAFPLLQPRANARKPFHGSQILSLGNFPPPLGSVVLSQWELAAGDARPGGQFAEPWGGRALSCYVIAARHCCAALGEASGGAGGLGGGVGWAQELGPLGWHPSPANRRPLLRVTALGLPGRRVLALEGPGCSGFSGGAAERGWTRVSPASAGRPRDG